MMERKELTAFWFEYSGISISAEMVWAAGLSRPLCRVQNLPVHFQARIRRHMAYSVQYVDAKINFPQFKMSRS